MSRWKGLENYPVYLYYISFWRFISFNNCSANHPPPFYVTYLVHHCHTINFTFKLDKQPLLISLQGKGEVATIYMMMMMMMMRGKLRLVKLKKNKRPRISQSSSSHKKFALRLPSSQYLLQPFLKSSLSSCSFLPSLFFLMGFYNKTPFFSSNGYDLWFIF